MEANLVILSLSVVTLLCAFYGYTVEQRICLIKEELVKAENQHIKEINEMKVELKSKSMTEHNSAHSKELEDIRLILQETANVCKKEFYEIKENITPFMKENIKTRYEKPLNGFGKAIRDCSDLPKDYRNGIYKIQPTNLNSDGFNVYCQMVVDGGGWTVIQRRESGDLEFYQKWTKYKEGFGHLNREFWLGNDYIHTITSQGRYELRIDLRDFDNNHVNAKYQHFYVGDESSNYKLNVYGYSGAAGDSLKYHNGMPFSTFDKDNDKSQGNCAESVNGAWWFNDCFRSNLNGHFFIKTPPQVWRGIIWADWKGRNYSLSATEMMIRRL